MPAVNGVLRGVHASAEADDACWRRSGWDGMLGGGEGVAGDLAGPVRGLVLVVLDEERRRGGIAAGRRGMTSCRRP